MKQLKTIFLTSIIIVSVMIMGLTIYAKTVDLTIATEKDVFVKTDLEETDFGSQTITAELVESKIDDEKTQYQLSYTIPTLIKNEDKSYSVQETQQGTSISLEHYNGCRRSGNDKTQCVAYIKELATNEIKEAKKQAIEQANRLKIEVEKIDYLSEITVEDFANVDINPVKVIEIIAK